MKKSSKFWVKATYLSDKPNKFGLRPMILSIPRTIRSYKIGDQVLAITYSRGKTLPEGLVFNLNDPWVSFVDVNGKKHRRHAKNLKTIKKALK